MLTFKSSRVLSLYMAIIAALAILATTPTPVQAVECFLECAGMTGEIFLCHNVIKEGEPNVMPKIGVDAARDNCLCTQKIASLYRKCECCRDPNNGNNATNQFIADCKLQNPSRILANSADSSFASKLSTIHVTLFLFNLIVWSTLMA